MLSSRGVDPARIQAMGRWRSPMVLHYATQALGTGLAAIVERHMPLVQPRTDAAADTAAIRRWTASLDRRLAVLEALEPAPPPPFQPAPTHDIIENCDSGSVHRRSSRKFLSTYCGWKFEHKEHRLHLDVPPDTKWELVCAYCLPAERVIAKAGQVRSEVSDSE